MNGRFAFGENWQEFLKRIDGERIREGQRSLAEMLVVTSLEGRSFLDVGAGSGLFSLAAARLGAGPIHSFDVDPVSTACVHELRRRFSERADGWTIETGSVLDEAFLRRLGRWDVVYSWGVLHHSGDLEQAMANVAGLVAERGLLFVGIYNDQGLTSRVWWCIKRAYNRLPKGLRKPYAVAIMLPLELRSLARHVITGRVREYIRSWTGYRRSRGMSKWHDLIDWVGGYPFEVARPEEVFRFYRDQGFELVNLATCAGGWGCNQYVFRAVRGSDA